MRKIILASASPRRRELLERAGFEFEVMTSGAEEKANTSDAELMVRELALLKAGAVAKTAKNNALVIGADTVVCLKDEILGKPKNEADAKEMLKKLSGRAHSVYTGVCVTDTKTGKSVCKSERTDVFFRNISDEEICEYVKTGEPMDKAGAYAIQGGAAKFVSACEGNLDNVIGLPVELVKEIIQTEFTV